MKKVELLESIKNKLGCEYISDLSGVYSDKAKKEFLLMKTEGTISDYSIGELSNAVNYLFYTDKKFENHDQVYDFLRSVE